MFSLCIDQETISFTNYQVIVNPDQIALLKSQVVKISPTF